MNHILCNVGLHFFIYGLGVGCHVIHRYFDRAYRINLESHTGFILEHQFALHSVPQRVSASLAHIGLQRRI